MTTIPAEDPAASGPDELARLCEGLALRARDARIALAELTGGARSALLNDTASALRASSREIKEANALDIEAASALPAAMRDRLALDDARIEKMASAVESIAEQPDPVGRVVDGRLLPNGISLRKRRVPIGLILVIYESRPNVTSDAAALCLKAGNAVLLKGGRESAHSNRAIVRAIRSALDPAGVGDAVTFVDTTERRATTLLVRMPGIVDLCVPRGGPGLIRAVCEAATIPVVKHDAGVCHVYIDDQLEGVRDDAVAIAMNAKVQRPGVCNAAETLIVHRGAANDVLPELGPKLRDAGVELRCDDESRRLLPWAQPADEEDWPAEYLDLTVAVRVVGSLDEACAHIRRYGSGHTDAIVTASLPNAQRFMSLVDSANVMVNCSTRFSDGGEYGLGAEIGISTDKLHARGPMGAEDLTTFQWVLEGSGQVRP